VALNLSMASFISAQNNALKGKKKEVTPSKLTFLLSSARSVLAATNRSGKDDPRKPLYTQKRIKVKQVHLSATKTNPTTSHQIVKAVKI
jgi:hypothetical protein